MVGHDLTGTPEHEHHERGFDTGDYYGTDDLAALLDHDWTVEIHETRPPRRDPRGLTAHPRHRPARPAPPVSGGRGPVGCNGCPPGETTQQDTARESERTSAQGGQSAPQQPKS